MRSAHLIMLFPIAFTSQAANVVDYSKVDLSKVLNNTKQGLTVASEPLSYHDISRVNTNTTTLLRKKQLHYGIPVYGQSVVVDLSKQGVAKAVDGQVLTGIESDIGSTLPMINAKQAVDIAKSQHKGIAAATIRDPHTELVIWLDDQQSARLIYKIDFLQTKGMAPSRPITLVDAKSGELLEQWEGIAFLEAEGPGGNEKSGRYYFGSNTQYGGFQVNPYCQMDSENVVTLNMNNQQSSGQIHQFSCSDNNGVNVNNYRAVNGAYAPMNDAHYFGQRVFDMYQDWLNTRPIKQKLTMRVHYGSNYGNAFWDGRQMTFGDGNQSMYPLATWDVIAHEVSHGFTEQNSGLEYRGMSGGMNESFSDVAAAALSEYVHGSFNWKMGEHVMKHSDAMRYFIQPSQDGVSIDHVNQYYNGIDVHHSSGIFNKAFYHLSTSNNWGIKKAFEAYATANQLYWTPNSDFQQGADGVCKAAQDLGYETSAVRIAFNEVGIDVEHCGSGQPNPPLPSPTSDVVDLEINMPTPILSDGEDQQQFVLKNTPADEVWVQTYNGYGEVDMYVAIGRPATLSDYDCASTNQGNREYCGLNGVTGADIYVMASGAQGSMDAYVAVSADLEAPKPEPQPEPKPEPQGLCDNLQEWNPNYYYPAGTAIQYYGNRFSASADNWGADPFNNYWYWVFEGTCD
ncbi:M4 family metallopeptidase [Vibrio sp. L3-7]|uniref:M4 family metallopeptidase n=1 Tax=Vibrio sp. L3-7 TaxID=2912253 RepID=UPI00118F2EFE|nr:M4 family metallopeptidase [Vibrio sp. L3-7]MCF7502801.1 M4 family metallopeptidase [Vibrio sp. L3-7]TVU78698.1 peptidase M4 family protein [Vibrio tasmaniensis]